MKLERTFNIDDVKSVIFQPDIFKTIAEDGQTESDVKIDIKGDCWVAVRVNETIVGVYLLHPHNSITLEIHAHILPEFRKKHSIQSGRKVLEWFVNNCDYLKLIAQVPDIYENVKQFCLANNFKVEGVNRKSYKKDGEVMDSTLLGITRDEIKGFLDGVH